MADRFIVDFYNGQEIVVDASDHIVTEDDALMHALTTHGEWPGAPTYDTERGDHYQVWVRKEVQ